MPTKTSISEIQKITDENQLCKVLGVFYNNSEIGSVVANLDFNTIKKNYHRLCLEQHPDKGGKDIERFQNLNNAYSLLEDYISDKGTNLVSDNNTQSPGDAAKSSPSYLIGDSKQISLTESVEDMAKNWLCKHMLSYPGMTFQRENAAMFKDNVNKSKYEVLLYKVEQNEHLGNLVILINAEAADRESLLKRKNYRKNFLIQDFELVNNIVENDNNNISELHCIIRMLRTIFSMQFDDQKSQDAIKQLARIKNFTELADIARSLRKIGRFYKYQEQDGHSLQNQDFLKDLILDSIINVHNANANNKASSALVPVSNAHAFSASPSVLFEETTPHAEELKGNSLMQIAEILFVFQELYARFITNGHTDKFYSYKLNSTLDYNLVACVLRQKNGEQLAHLLKKFYDKKRGKAMITGVKEAQTLALLFEAGFKQDDDVDFDILYKVAIKMHDIRGTCTKLMRLEVLQKNNSLKKDNPLFEKVLAYFLETSHVPKSLIYPDIFNIIESMYSLNFNTDYLNDNFKKLVYLNENGGHRWAVGWLRTSKNLNKPGQDYFEDVPATFCSEEQEHDLIKNKLFSHKDFDTLVHALNGFYEFEYRSRSSVTSCTVDAKNKFINYLLLNSVNTLQEVKVIANLIKPSSKLNSVDIDCFIESFCNNDAVKQYSLPRIARVMEILNKYGSIYSGAKDIPLLKFFSDTDNYEFINLLDLYETRKLEDVCNLVNSNHNPSIDNFINEIKKIYSKDYLKKLQKKQDGLCVAIREMHNYALEKNYVGVATSAEEMLKLWKNFNRNNFSNKEDFQREFKQELEKLDDKINNHKDSSLTRLLVAILKCFATLGTVFIFSHYKYGDKYAFYTHTQRQKAKAEVKLAFSNTMPNQ